MLTSQRTARAVKLDCGKVYRYPGGNSAWKGAGFPVEKADQGLY